MAEPTPAYRIADKFTVAQSPDVRVTLMTLDPGQEIPWHSHSIVTDSSFCLAGEVEIALADPDETKRLSCGQWRQVSPARAHRVRCLGPSQCKVLLVQGGGPYDFLPASQVGQAG